MSDDAANVASGEGAPEPDAQPVPPNPDDYSGCCGGGCNPCVFDLYWDAHARYEISLAAWQERQARERPGDNP